LPLSLLRSENLREEFPQAAQVANLCSVLPRSAQARFLSPLRSIQ